MNQSEYQAYRERVNNFLALNMVKPGCHGPQYDEQGNAPDPFFSWNRCECCDSPLGGDRERYTFAMYDGQTFEADICTDCVYYLAYGVLDDMTMMAIES